MGYFQYWKNYSNQKTFLNSCLLFELLQYFAPITLTKNSQEIEDKEDYNKEKTDTQRNSVLTQPLNE